MKQSIRVRFTCIFVTLLAVVLIGIWCVNNWALEKFYFNNKVAVLENAYQELNDMIVEQIEAGNDIRKEITGENADGSTTQTPLNQLINNLSDQYSISIAMMGADDQTIASTGRDKNFLLNRALSYILEKNVPKRDLVKITENYTIQQTFDNHSKAMFLESWGYFSDNNTIFIMSLPLASIRESVQLSNRFLTYVGIFALILGFVIVYFTTKRVTSPILELASISEKMSNLDFEAKYQGNAEDEIGILGNSMNALSDKLKDAIGNLKSANMELQNDIEQKIKIDEMRKDFIANVSHELKTPIALIQGYAEGLTEGMCENKESRDYYCEVIMDEANKMNTMVRQLLTLTALEFGNDTISVERFDIVELIQGVITSAKLLIDQKEAAVEFDTQEPVYVWADEFKIEEVVTNYLSNALNHISGEKQIRIQIEKNKSDVKVSVFNTGEQIPEDDLDKIWSKFYKVDKARTREYGGSGIGLSIVKAIIESHNKTCGVENVENGVQFWFTLDAQSAV